MPPTKGHRLPKTLTITAPQPVELLTIDQAAERINMSARYVRRLIAERRIAFYRIGRSVRIDPADLAHLITAGRIEPITETTVWNDLRSAA
jgi:excisionase family DNA binding protein